MEHEQLVVRRGARSGLTMMVAIHSSALGQPIGGCRLRHYPDWRDGMADALRLSRAMTYKNALADLTHGGAKAVIVAPAPEPLNGNVRRAALLDLGDLVESLDGRYATGPDSGTGPDDMLTIAERTEHVFCRPAAYGGSGDSSPPTARGVLAAVRATLAHLKVEIAGSRIVVLGLGSVGVLAAEHLAARGARLVAADLDAAKRPAAQRLGATWSHPDEAVRLPTDVLVPAAVGGLLTPALVPELRCAAIAGPANNQLTDDSAAELLRQRGICWVPDYVVGAGGVIHATGVERRGESPAEALAAVDRIGDTVARVLAAADEAGITPHEAALRLAEARLTGARPAEAGARLTSAQTTDRCT
jgi:leucine dehydrogenase